MENEIKKPTNQYFDSTDIDKLIDYLKYIVVDFIAFDNNSDYIYILEVFDNDFIGLYVFDYYNEKVICTDNQNDLVSHLTFKEFYDSYL